MQELLHGWEEGQNQDPDKKGGVSDKKGGVSDKNPILATMIAPIIRPLAIVKTLVIFQFCSSARINDLPILHQCLQSGSAALQGGLPGLIY